MKCPVCGAENEPNTLYCYQCGSSLRSAANPQPATGPTVSLAREPSFLEPSDIQPSRPTQPSPAPETANPVPSAHDARVYDVPAPMPQPSYAPPPVAPPPQPIFDSPQVPVAPVPSAPYVVGPSFLSTTQTSNMAVFSLILGLLSWFLLPFLGAIGAVITGHMARREIRSAGGRFSGDGLALTGLILGYLNLFAVVAACAFFSILVGLGAS